MEVSRRLDKCDQVGWLEINVSCPNVHGGGIAFGTDAGCRRSGGRSAVKDACQQSR